MINRTYARMLLVDGEKFSKVEKKNPMFFRKFLITVTFFLQLFFMPRFIDVLAFLSIFFR